jgi:hypothetical protein
LQEAVRGDGCRKAGQGAVRARRFADIALPRHEFIQGNIVSDRSSDHPIAFCPRNLTLSFSTLSKNQRLNESVNPFGKYHFDLERMRQTADPAPGETALSP